MCDELGSGFHYLFMKILQGVFRKLRFLRRLVTGVVCTVVLFLLVQYAFPGCSNSDAEAFLTYLVSTEQHLRCAVLATSVFTRFNKRHSLVYIKKLPRFTLHRSSISCACYSTVKLVLVAAVTADTSLIRLAVYASWQKL